MGQRNGSGVRGADGIMGLSGYRDAFCFFFLSRKPYTHYFLTDFQKQSEGAAESPSSPKCCSTTCAGCQESALHVARQAGQPLLRVSGVFITLCTAPDWLMLPQSGLPSLCPFQHLVLSSCAHGRGMLACGCFEFL